MRQKDYFSDFKIGHKGAFYDRINKGSYAIITFRRMEKYGLDTEHSACVELYRESPIG
jgi:hypothetical protein